MHRIGKFLFSPSSFRNWRMISTHLLFTSWLSYWWYSQIMMSLRASFGCCCLGSTPIIIVFVLQKMSDALHAWCFMKLDGPTLYCFLQNTPLRRLSRWASHCLWLHIKTPPLMTRWRVLLLLVMIDIEAFVWGPGCVCYIFGAWAAQGIVLMFHSL